MSEEEKPQPTIEVKLKLEVTWCAVCGTRFAFDSEWMAKLRKNQGSFWCPAGHTLHFPPKSVEEVRQEKQVLLQAAKPFAPFGEIVEQLKPEIFEIKPALRFSDAVAKKDNGPEVVEK